MPSLHFSSFRRSLRRIVLVLALSTSAAAPVTAQPARTYTRADSLQGSMDAPARIWWDVTFYDLHVKINPSDSTIRGYNTIVYRVLEPSREMQIDLQEPLRVDSIAQDGRPLPFRKDGNAYFVTPAAPQAPGTLQALTVYYGGTPHVARRPPWEGGITWGTDELGRPWIVTTDEGIGPSVWWPLKDSWVDEPDSANVALTVPDPLVHVGNGRLRRVIPNEDGTTTWDWFVTNPINGYAINVNVGTYTHYGEILHGERGMLTTDFWPLDYNLERAKEQFPQALSMLSCFEDWFGPYPWYEDGYKLVDVPYPGMEHQSAVTYGNGYSNGYGGRDGSGTGLGMEWDFIIIHESAHEWFANNITAKDHADMWVHEAFANYAEGLYSECLFGKEAGARYTVGTRRGIRNDRPIIPEYGVGAQGSGDMYPKGGNLLHTIRQIVGDDEEWRRILRGLNRTFWHQTVMGTEVEAYISREAGIDLNKVFDQYLRTTMIPTLEYRIEGSRLSYRWANVVPGFAMQVGVTLDEGGYTVIHPTEDWKTAVLNLSDPSEFSVDPDYYVDARERAAAGSAGSPVGTNPGTTPGSSG
jgi:aminopeptidase N